MEKSLDAVTCPLCANSGSTVFVIKNNYPVRRCPSCRLLFVHPLPSTSSQIYSADYFQGAQAGFGYTDYDTDKEAMRDTFIKYLEYIEKYKKGPGRLLDVGAATGFFLSIAKERGWEVFGVEISDFAAEVARKKGFEVRTGTLGEVNFPLNHFDVITVWDVIEHVANPEGEIKIMFEYLRPGGLIAFNTPDASSLMARALGGNWHALVPPEHLYYFSPDNLGQLLTKQNFIVLNKTSFKKKFTLAYIYKTLAHWQPWLKNTALTRWLEKSVVGTWALPLYLGDNFFQIARKPEL